MLAFLSKWDFSDSRLRAAIGYDTLVLTINKFELKI